MRERRLEVVIALGKAPRFHAVRRQQCRVRQQQFCKRVHHLIARKLVATAGRQHRIQYQRDTRIVGNDFGDRRNVLNASQHTDLDRVDLHILEQAARLIGDPIRIDRENVFDARRVLHGECRHDRQGMAAHAGERQKIGLQTGAAGRIGRSERENDGRALGLRVGHWGTSEQALEVAKSNAFANEIVTL